MIRFFSLIGLIVQDLNHVYTLSDRENAHFSPFNIGAMEINYLINEIHGWH
jgi:hypothetical protein